MNKHTTAYYKTLPHFVDPSVMILNQRGGMRSSKTYSDAQLLTEYGMRRRDENVIKIIGQSVPHMRDNVIQDFKNVANDYGIPFSSIYKETKRRFDINSTRYLFLSADVDNVLGGQADITYINEANAKVFKWETVQQLLFRTKKKFIFDYNPKNKFWLHTHYDELKAMGMVDLHYTYKDNEYIPQGILANIKSAKEGTWFHNVFVLGEEALPEGIIYTNWERGTWKEGVPYVYGVDFGSTNPECIIKVGYDHDENKTYVQEIYYDKKINKGTQGIIEACVECKKRDNEEVGRKKSTVFHQASYNPVFIPDPAGKAQIVDMKKAGLNCPKFVKPEVIWRIRRLQDSEIIVCGDSFNVEQELGSYVWKSFEAGIPEKENDHTMDAIGYAHTYLTTKGVGVNRNAYANRRRM